MERTQVCTGEGQEGHMCKEESGKVTDAHSRRVERTQVCTAREVERTQVCTGRR